VTRRMVLTKKDLFLGLEEQDEIRDRIPLHEIDEVSFKQDREADGDGAEAIKTPSDFGISGPRQATRGGLQKVKTVSTYRFFNGFQIETVKDGFNSGRAYHAQAETKEECNLVVTTLKKYARLAKQANLNANRFERSQKLMLRLYSSFFFQALSAILILTVL
jgi:hypothetical protein